MPIKFNRSLKVGNLFGSSRGSLKGKTSDLWYSYAKLILGPISCFGLRLTPNVPLFDSILKYHLVQMEVPEYR